MDTASGGIAGDTASRAVGQAHLGALNLSFAGLASQMPNDLGYLGHAGGTHRVTFGEESATWIYRQFAVNLGPTLIQPLAVRSFGNQSQPLDPHTFGDRKTIMNFGQI